MPYEIAAFDGGSDAPIFGLSLSTMASCRHMMTRQSSGKETKVSRYVINRTDFMVTSQRTVKNRTFDPTRGGSIDGWSAGNLTILPSHACHQNPTKHYFPEIAMDIDTIRTQAISLRSAIYMVVVDFAVTLRDPGPDPESEHGLSDVEFNNACTRREGDLARFNILTKAARMLEELEQELWR
jgi:hypothetical protein